MKKLIILFAFAGCCDCPEVRIPPSEPTHHYLQSQVYHDAAKMQTLYRDSATWALNKIHKQKNGDSAQFYMDLWKTGYPAKEAQQAAIMDSIRRAMP